MAIGNKLFLIESLNADVFQNDPDRKKELAELSEMFIEREYPCKQSLVMAGEKWDRVFFIHRGIIRLYYTDPDGREFNKGFFREGQFLWPVAPSARRDDSLFSIAALEDIKISVCRFAPFYSWLVHHGCWERFALRYAERFAEEKFLREYDFLVTSASERFRKFCIENPDLAERIPDYHLATYLGITNVSLSRIKKSINFNIC